MDQDEEKIYIRIPVSGKLVVSSIVALVLAFGAYPVANRINPDARSDPFTGAEGNDLADRIDVLELDVSSCQKRNSNHREAQASILATLKTKIQSNEYLIKQCMKITRQ